MPDEVTSEPRVSGSDQARLRHSRDPPLAAIAAATMDPESCFYHDHMFGMRRT